MRVKAGKIKQLTNAVSMLGQRRKWWPSIETTLVIKHSQTKLSEIPKSDLEPKPNGLQVDLMTFHGTEIFINLASVVQQLARKILQCEKIQIHYYNYYVTISYLFKWVIISRHLIRIMQPAFRNMTTC